MKIAGILLMVFALVDFVGGFAGIDVWGEWIGVQLPDLVWRFSAYIEGIAGYALFNYGSSDEQETETTPIE